MNWLYIAVKAAVTYIVRVLPITLIQKPIQNRFVRSFLYYVPYVTLSIMTFPAIVEATNYPLAGILALVTGVVVAWLGANLFKVAVSCCAIVLITECLIKFC